MVEKYGRGTIDGETIASSMANNAIKQSNLSDLSILVTNHGRSGQPYSNIKKGTEAYQSAIDRIKKAKQIAISLGKEYEVSAIAVIHGEADWAFGRTMEEYKGF